MLRTPRSRTALAAHPVSRLGFWNRRDSPPFPFSSWNNCQIACPPGLRYQQGNPMKMTQLAGVAWLLLFVAFRCASDPLTLAEPRPAGAGVELIVRSAAPAPAAVEARLQRTRDLRSWKNLGPKIKLPAGTVIDDWTIGADSGQQGFFRLVTRPTEFTSSLEHAVGVLDPAQTRQPSVHQTIRHASDSVFVSSRIRRTSA